MLSRGRKENKERVDLRACIDEGIEKLFGDEGLEGVDLTTYLHP